MNGVEVAALAWNAARLEANRLKRARSDERCEHEEGPDYAQGYGGFPPCWARARGDEAEPVEAWCEPCKRGHAFHLQYKEAAAKRGVLLRRLERACDSMSKPASEVMEGVRGTGDGQGGVEAQ